MSVSWKTLRHLFFGMSAFVLPLAAYAAPAIPAEAFLEPEFLSADVEDYPALAPLKDYVSEQRFYKAVSAPRATLAVFGGFNSCFPGPYQSDIYGRALDLLRERAEQGEYFRVVVGCFGRTSKTITYYTSSDLDDVKRGSAADIMGAIAREASLTHTNHVYLAGHSYGGWMVLRAAEDLPEQINVKGLASIDPISTVYCSPGVFIKAYLSSSFSLNPDPDCTRAPRDIAAAAASLIKARVGWWHNFYQNDSLYLHSSSIPGAINKFIEYTNTSIFGIVSAHMSIDVDDRVWNVFEDKIAGQ